MLSSLVAEKPSPAALLHAPPLLTPQSITASNPAVCARSARACPPPEDALFARRRKALPRCAPPAALRHTSWRLQQPVVMTSWGWRRWQLAHAAAQRVVAGPHGVPVHDAVIAVVGRHLPHVAVHDAPEDRVPRRHVVAVHVGVPGTAVW